jgi:hypothetical protein
MLKKQVVKIPCVFKCSVDGFAFPDNRLVKMLQRQGSVPCGFIFLEDGIGIAESSYNLHNEMCIALVT